MLKRILARVGLAAVRENEPRPQVRRREAMLNAAIRKGRQVEYACDDTIAARQLSDLNASPESAEYGASSDPYNSSDFDVPKTWESGTRK